MPFQIAAFGFAVRRISEAHTGKHPIAQVPSLEPLTPKKSSPAWPARVDHSAAGLVVRRQRRRAACLAPCRRRPRACCRARDLSTLYRTCRALSAEHAVHVTHAACWCTRWKTGAANCPSTSYSLTQEATSTELPPSPVRPFWLWSQSPGTSFAAVHAERARA